MKAARVTVAGFPQLDRQLARIERKLTRDDKVIALTAGAEVIAAEERLLAPKRTGRLAGSIVVTAEAVALPKGDIVYTGPSLPNGWYGLLVERGTSRNAPKPFARVALATKSEEAAGVVVARLAQALRLQ